MSIEAIGSILPELVSTAVVKAPAAGSGAAGPAVSVFDVANFRAAMNDPATAPAAQTEPTATSTPVASVAESETVRGFIEPLELLNQGAQGLGGMAESFLANGREMTPSDMIRLTVASHEFMFQCELTSNVANRTSDGVQQLFRQQS